MFSISNPSSKARAQNANIYSPMAAVAFKSSFIFGIIALVILFLYSIGEAANFGKFLDILGIVIVIAFASFSAGGIIGFLFGIPHTIQQNTLINTSNSANNAGSAVLPGANNPAPINAAGSTTSAQSVTATPSINSSSPPKSNFTPSTNLEQIADWLTKILVGVGLTQIHKLIALFNQLSIALGTTLQHYSSTHHNGSLIVGCVIILFSIEGFLIVYLWTYLYLIKIQDSMSAEDIIDTINTKIEHTDVHDKKAIDLASTQLSLPEGSADIPKNELLESFRNASKNVISSIFFKAVSVRKQNWKNLDTKFRIEKAIPIFEALIGVDNKFEFPENFAELGFSLKDKRVPDYKQALANLDKAISGFANNDRIPNKAITFFNRAYCRIKVDPNFANNTLSTAENKQLILSDLLEASKEAYVAAIIANDPVDTTINDWKRLNP